MIVVTLVTVAPLLFVSLASWLERASAHDLEQNCLAVARRLDAFSSADVIREAEALGKEVEVRLRVLSPTGGLILDFDHDQSADRLGLIGGFFFGPEGPPTLASWDVDQRPLKERPEVRAALEGASLSGCSPTASGPLLVCFSAQKARPAEVAGVERDVVFYIQQSRPRAIRALFDLRYQLLKLTLLVLPGALLLAWWLGWRMILPVEKLRQQVEQHRALRVGSPNLKLQRSDEFGQLATAFNELLRQLEERGRENEAFVADLAHEFKNPVAAIRAAAESLAQGAVDEARAQRLARVLGDSSKRLDALVTSLLELAHAEAGLVGEERGPIELRVLMERLVETLEADDRYQGVVFEVVSGVSEAQRSKGDPRAFIDGVPGRLETAARNLVENAASFAAQGDGKVTVTVRRHGATVLLEVQDNGPGISQENIARVFERFFTTRGHREGTGLGLALVKAVVEAHQGNISVVAPPEGGAVFRLEFPACPSPPSPTLSVSHANNAVSPTSRET